MLLSLNDATFGYQGVPVLEDVSLSVHEKERVGILGGNGEGKTTLLRLMIGELVPDRGEVFRKSGLKIGYLEQNGGLESDATVYEAMKEVFAEDEALIAKLRAAERELANADEAQTRALSAKIESLNRRIAARDSYQTDVKVRTVLGGMGFDGCFDQIVSTMSGGEKTRLKLCKLLLEDPELLVLDEPTNHLDVKTLFWLEEYLSSLKGTLVVVSHDRYFLDALTERTVEIERGRVVSYKGNYSKYRVLKEERYKERLRAWEKQQEEIAKLKDYVDRNLVRATTAKSALSRVNKLDRMELLEKPLPPREPPRFRFSYAERPYEKVIEAPRFDLFAAEKRLLSNASFTLFRGEKCALVGDNGTGKTTLLRFLRKEGPEVKHARFVRVAYYDQENAGLDAEERVLDAFWGENSSLTQTEARALLAQAGLDAEDVEKKCSELSGGLRAKLALALLEARRGNVLLLDEPTNHLDLDARESLEEALCAFDGTVLFVSHDRRFIEAVANRIVRLEDGKLERFSGSYRELVEAERTAPAEKKPKESTKPTPSGGFRSKEERARQAREKARAKEIERELALVEEETDALNAELAASGANYLRVKEITARLSELEARSEALYAEYETLL